jgi:ribosomal protein S18 acetylase RimI-like enzyme
MLCLRPAGAGDLVRMVELDRVCFPPEIAYSQRELRHYLNQPRCVCWLAHFRSSSLSAFILVERLRHGPALHGHLLTIDVEPAARRVGTARLLLQIAEKQLKEEGAASLKLEVAANNLAALRLYRGCGFVKVGRIAGYYPNGADAEVMEKSL